MNTHASHPHHHHQLHLIKNDPKPYPCDGCKEQGFGSRYRCATCNYDLHEDCMFIKPFVSHGFFQRSTFKFFYFPPGKTTRICDACGKPINGFVYHSEKNGWDLHPCCLNLKNKLHIDGVKFRLKNKVSSSCIWCHQKKLKGSISGIRGWSYVSKCNQYHCHVYCVTEMVFEGWKNSVENDGTIVAIDNTELPINGGRLNRNGGRGKKYWKIMKMFLSAIAGILLGDPTTILTGLFFQLVSD